MTHTEYRSYIKRHTRESVDRFARDRHLVTHQTQRLELLGRIYTAKWSKILKKFKGVKL